MHRAVQIAPFAGMYWWTMLFYTAHWICIISGMGCGDTAYTLPVSCSCNSYLWTFSRSPSQQRSTVIKVEFFFNIQFFSHSFAASESSSPYPHSSRNCRCCGTRNTALYTDDSVKVFWFNLEVKNIKSDILKTLNKNDANSYDEPCQTHEFLCIKTSFYGHYIYTRLLTFLSLQLCGCITVCFICMYA